MFPAHIAAVLADGIYIGWGVLALILIAILVYMLIRRR
jgi:hypothetical protein